MKPLLIFLLLATCICGSISETFYIPIPGNPPPPLPEITRFWVNDGQLAIGTKGPSILQRCGDLGSPVWKGISATDRLHVIDLDPNQDAYFFRLAAFSKMEKIYVPQSYDPKVPSPLVLVLHGNGGCGDSVREIWGYDALAEVKNFICVHPNGSTPRSPNASCEEAWQWGGQNDSDNLRRLILEVQNQYNVDANRIYLIGGSGGAYKAIEMACDYSDVLAGFASVAGGIRSSCDQPFSPDINMLFVHGRQDTNVVYSASLQTIARINTDLGYSPANTDELQQLVDETPTTLDLVGPELAECKVNSFTPLEAEAHVELWTLEGSDHYSVFWGSGLKERMNPAIIDWLFTHPKPGPNLADDAP